MKTEIPVRVHEFEIEAPLYTRPANPLGDYGTNDIRVVMDGVEVKGVQNLMVKSGANGYTNVVLDMKAPALLRFTGVAFVTATNEQRWNEQVVGNLMKRALEEIVDGDLGSLESDFDMMGSLGTRFMALVAEYNGGDISGETQV